MLYLFYFKCGPWILCLPLNVSFHLPTVLIHPPLLCLSYRFLSARCKYYFDSMLAQRSFIGSMAFDHKNETLSISVRPFDLSVHRCVYGIGVVCLNLFNYIYVAYWSNPPYWIPPLPLTRCSQVQETRLTWVTCAPCQEASVPSPLFASFSLSGPLRRRPSAASTSLMSTW